MPDGGVNSFGVPAAPRRIGVITDGELIGDALYKFPFLRALRRAFPADTTAWIALDGPTPYADVLRPVIKSYLDEVYSGLGFRSRPRDFFRPMPKLPYCDILIDSRAKFRSVLMARRIPHGLFISGSARFLTSDRRPAKGYKRPDHVVERMLDLLELASGEPPQPFGTVEIHGAAEAAARQLLPANGVRYVGIAPGAGGRIKCWPLDNYVELARRTADRSTIPVFILGPQESAWVANIRAAVPGAILPGWNQDGSNGEEIAAAGPLRVMAVAKRLNLAVANDSGTSHMIAAVDTPLISLFGPTPAAKFAPLVSRRKVLTAQQFGSEEMSAIPVEAVESAVSGLLAETVVAASNSRAWPLP